ncbi:unnamed protein product [Urochloa humidicola]
MELEQERKLREERILRETLEHQLSGEKKVLEDLKKPGPTEEQETELELLRKENSLLLQELSRSKEEAGCAIAKMQELDARCQKLEKDRIADRQEAEEECNLLREETSCLLLELSRSKQEAGRLIAKKRAQLEELLARCTALQNEKSSLAQELSWSAQEANRVAVEKLRQWRARCAALEEELSASRREAERLAAELDAEKRQRRAEAADWEVDAAAVGWELARLLAKSEAIVAHARCIAAEQQAAVPCP